MEREPTTMTHVEIDGTDYVYDNSRLSDLEALSGRVKALRDQGKLSLDVLYRIRKYFRIKNIYHSNAIEGNVLAVGETRQVVEHGLTIIGKPLRDQAEARNLSHALDFLEELAVNTHTPIIENDVRQLHTLVLDGLSDEAGAYRSVPVTISGSDYLPPGPESVPAQMEEFGQWLSGVSVPGDDAFAGTSGLVAAAAAHTWFVTVHPFIDGNGRVARLLMNLMLMRHGFPIAIITKEDRLRYYDAIAARGKSHAGGVTRPGTDGVLPSRFGKVAPRSARSRAEVARNPLGDGHLRSSALSFVGGDHPDRHPPHSAPSDHRSPPRLPRDFYHGLLEISQASDLTPFVVLLAECIAESLEEYEAAAEEQREQTEWATSLAEKFTQPERIRAENEYEVWKNAMELLKSYLQQTVDVFNQATPYGRVYLKDFGSLEFEKYSALRRGESAKRTWFLRVDFRRGDTFARYLFFFGYASHPMRARCDVTLHVAREEPPGSFNYERLEHIQSSNVPDLAEIGYEMSKERFVVRMRNGRSRTNRVEEFTKLFFEDVVQKHFAN